MFIGIDMGHTVSGANYGAVGILKESEQTRVLGNKIINLLKGLGNTVINCTVDKAMSNTDSITKRINKANSQRLDLFVSVHFNASNGSGNGTEVLTANGKYMIEADRILKNISDIGFKNRGIKDGTSPRRIGVINSTKSRALLVEVCFVDNKSDAERYKLNVDNIAKAIVEGITGNSISMNNDIGDDEDMIPKTVKLSACVDSKIRDQMIEQIKLLQGLYKLEVTGQANYTLLDKLPVFKGGESKGTASILQSILIIKGYLSKSNDRPPLGGSVKNALDRIKSDNGIPITDELTNKLVWMKLLEY